MHLGMSGSLAFPSELQRLAPAGAHDHFDLLTTRGSLRLTDPRRFGAVVWSPDLHSGIGGQAARRPRARAVRSGLRRRCICTRRCSGAGSPIKQALLGGDIVVGAGNIYACEALACCRHRPAHAQRPHSAVRAASGLRQALRATLARALDAGGSTLRDFRDAHGMAGRFQLQARRLWPRRRGLPALRRHDPPHRPGAAVDLLLRRLPAPLSVDRPLVGQHRHARRRCDAAADGFADRVIAWQRSAGRHALPWQHTRDPYRVWLSEIMLQQTQVATVLGYYAALPASAFPMSRSLAAAPLDDVLALWSGLGYYSRARNLHRCAQAVVDATAAHFRAAAAALAELPGIGRSTAAAIAAFCFGERVAILDGNVKRVLSRVLGFEGDLAQAAQQRALWD